MSFIAILFTLFFQPSAQPGFYDFSFKTLEGKEISMSQFKGKKVLIVNTASKCGYTPQYAELEKLNDTYGKKGLVIIGFPANDFMGQEPGSNSEIKDFCQKNYGVSFLMSEKITVKGPKTPELFKWLMEQPNPDFTGKINWNFEKFLIDENGKLIHRFRSGVKPLAPELTKFL
jgi:glutathione peroxidase